MDKILELIIFNWRNPKFGLAVANVFIFISISTTTLSIEKISFIQAAIITICFCTTYSLIWLFASQPPKTPRGKVGFYVCIETTDEPLIEDFFEELKRTISQSTYADKFFIKLVPQYFAKEIISGKSMLYFKKMRSHYMIYGRSIQRKKLNNLVTVIKIDGLVSHGAIAEDSSRIFGQEFRELLPKDLEIQADNDLTEIEFTADWTGCASKYIVATAALITGDFQFCITILEELSNQLAKKKGATHHGINLLKKNCQHRLSNAYENAASHFHQTWRETRNNEDLTKAYETFEKLNKLKGGNTHQYDIYKALYIFVTKNDCESALKELNKCQSKAITDPIWRLSKAFLLAYQEKHDLAQSEYEAAFNLNPSINTLTEIQEFIEWIMKKENDKNYLLYYLGLINLHGINHKELAEIDFNNFIKLDNRSLEKLKEKANLYLKKISVTTTYSPKEAGIVH